jgi:hypothetical protein
VQLLHRALIGQCLSIDQLRCNGFSPIFLVAFLASAAHFFSVAENT